MEKINIAELLKDCPKGMELYSPIFGEVYLDKIRPHLAIVVTTDKEQGDFKEEFLYDGRYGMNGECMLFPSKSKTTWDGFVPPVQFKDGDILSNGICICLYNGNESDKHYGCYVGVGHIDFPNYFINCAQNSYFTKENSRLATEEEKEKLFKAIKDNGYRWNSETKKLEKLIESKEEVVMSGIYFDREYYANEVELHLGDYEIEVRDGRTYAVFKNQETKISKPIFKVGDKIKHKDTVLTIINLQTNSYIVEDDPDNFGILMFSQQDKWELVKEPKFKIGDEIRKKDGSDYRLRTIESINNNYYIIKTPDWFDNCYITDKLPFNCQDEYELIYNEKFDINTLKPFESRVLVRDTDHYEWEGAIFGRYDGNTFFTIGGVDWKYCIPYEGNEHLLGKTDDCDGIFKIWES